MAIHFDTFLDKIWTLELGGCLGGTLGPPWGTFGTQKASISTSLAPRLATLSAAGGACWNPLATPGAPLGHHLGTPGAKSRKRAKRSPFLAPFLDSFREGCTCNPIAPVWSKHTLSTYFSHLFLSLEITRISDRARTCPGSREFTRRRQGGKGGTGRRHLGGGIGEEASTVGFPP